MQDVLTMQFLWATLIVGGIVGIVILAKVPEFLVALLLVGQDFVQFGVRLLGFVVHRRQFATAGVILFIPVVLLFLVIRAVRAREHEPVIGRPNFAFIGITILMGVILLVGLTYTGAMKYGSQKTVEYFTFGMAPMLVALVFIRDHDGIRRLLLSLLVVASSIVVLTSIHSLVVRGTLETTLMFGGGEEYFGGMELGGHGALSSAVVVMVSVLLGFAASRTETRYKVFPILILPIACFYALHAGTRSNMIASVFVLTVGYFLAYKGKRSVLVVAFLVLLIFAGILLYTAEKDVRERAFFKSWFDPESKHGTGYARIEALRRIPGFFLSAPVIGHGTGAWPRLTSGGDYYDYPHNMFAEVLVENGLVGLAVLLILWFILSRRLWRHLRGATPGTELYGVAVFGVCMVAAEFFTGLAHFGLAHHSCTLLLTSAVVLRTTFLAEEAVVPEVQTV